MLDANAQLRAFKSQLLLDLTSEGLRIQIVDAQSRPMFDLSSSELKPYAKSILREIGSALYGVENRISLSGHTDATPFAGGEKGFSNWELSSSRANASRRELILGGMDEAKVLRVVGLASTVMFDKQDRFNPINRRISIIVMNKKTEEAVLRDAAGLDVESAQEVKPETLQGTSSTGAEGTGR
jgi:chemotaxis protein MotB